MQAGVELRMPFLDYRIVEFAFRLPADFKVNNGFSKLILRKAGTKILPKDILNNKVKIGWNSPMGEWLNGIWKEWLMDELNSVDFAKSTLVNKAALKQMVNYFFSNDYRSRIDAQVQGQMIWLNLKPYLIEKANKTYHNFNA
jgi:asparagine synthase (glutamine-hydrolysing)